MESADVVIAGGGIMGCALAYQLAKRDVDVILLERDTLGSQSTGKCAGGVRQQFSMEANVRLQRLSVRLFEDFERETGQPADFRQIGYLFVLTLPQQVEDFRSNMEMWHRAGLTEARWVDPAEAARMVPVLNVDDVLGCTFCPKRVIHLQGEGSGNDSFHLRPLPTSDRCGARVAVCRANGN